ncbi:hypothetical protein E1294_08145 [Nonomuraea diastatica]|uniref:Uncharacterized protein n=1 Tax=Nonomuraea diastatica TaxID=1848329 RepID=A0A4V2YFM0_9ACTN|nr:hypothetical protein E1294_08145 [Nonomuraea diastatica]
MADALLSYASGVSGVPLLGETIGENFERAVARFGGHEALVDVAAGRRWTYSDSAAPACPPAACRRSSRSTPTWPPPSPTPRACVPGSPWTAGRCCPSPGSRSARPGVPCCTRRATARCRPLRAARRRRTTPAAKRAPTVTWTRTSRRRTGASRRAPGRCSASPTRRSGPIVTCTCAI